MKDGVIEILKKGGYKGQRHIILEQKPDIILK